MHNIFSNLKGFSGFKFTGVSFYNEHLKNDIYDQGFGCGHMYCYGVDNGDGLGQGDCYSCFWTDYNGDGWDENYTSIHGDCAIHNVTFELTFENKNA
jgi:hypothetical protein